MDAQAATEAFLNLVRASGSPVDDIWQDARWFSVERQAPHETGGGKVYHVHRMTRGGAGRDHRG